MPQNLIGWLLTRFSKEKLVVTFNDGTNGIIYFTNNVFGCGVSLGNYIILDYNNYYFTRNSKSSKLTYNHEHGHQKQSLYFGWFYFVFIGISSAIFNNLWDRLFHKKWDSTKRYYWYYSRYPEKWADKLGGVNR